MSEEVTELAGTPFGKGLASAFAKVSLPAAVVGLAGAFVADVLQPLAPAALLVTIGAAIGFPLMLLGAFLLKGTRMWTLPATVLAVFVALFSGGTFALQKTVGGERASVQGFIASRVPAVARMQADWLKGLKAKIETFQVTTAEWEGEPKEQVVKAAPVNPDALAKALRQHIEAKTTAGLAAANTLEERRELERRREAALSRVDDAVLFIQEAMRDQPSPEFVEAGAILTAEGVEKALTYLINANAADLKSLFLKAQLQDANLELTVLLSTLEDLTRRAPTWSQARLRLAETYAELGRADGTEPHLQAALDHASSPKERARALDLLGQFHADRAQWAKAEPLLAEALQLREADPGQDKVESLNHLGHVYASQGQYSQAAPLFQAAIERCREGARGKDRAWLAALGESLNHLGELHFAQRQYDQAQPLLVEALRTRQETLGWIEHPKTAESLNNLAELYWKEGNLEKAEPLYRAALDMDHRVFGQKHAAVARGMSNLGNFYLAQGNLDAAEPLFNGALKMREEVLGPAHSLVARSCYHMARLFLGQGKTAEAKALLERAAKIQEGNPSSGPEEAGDAANTLNSLAELEFAAGNLAGAEKLLTRSMPLNERSLPANSPELAKWYSVLADVYVAREKAPEAELYMTKAFAIHEKTLGSSEPKLAEATLKLAEFYQKIGRTAEAKMHYERLLGIVLHQSGPRHQDFILTRGVYADFLKTRMGMTEEASNTQVEQVIAAAQKKS